MHTAHMRYGSTLLPTLQYIYILCTYYIIFVEILLNVFSWFKKLIEIRT